MNIKNLKIGQVVKNYKELCSLLEMDQKGGNQKKAQLKELERFINYEKKGQKFVICEIYKEPLTLIKGNNTLPFIDEMEILLLNLLMKNNMTEYIISNSRLLLELCMINPNYLKYFSKRNELSEILELKIEHIIDHLDTTNSTFKSAINTAIKRLENRKLIIHENVMIVHILEPKIHITPNGYARMSDIYYYDNTNDKYIHKNVRPKENIRQATKEEKELIIQIENEVLENDFKCSTMQQIYNNGRIYDYFYTVSRRLYNELNIKKHYKAHLFTMNKDIIKRASIKYLNEIEELEKQKELNLMVIDRLIHNTEKRHIKAVNKEESDRTKKEIHRSDQDYIQNLKLLNDVLVSIEQYEPLKKADKKADSIEVDEYIINNLPEGM